MIKIFNNIKALIKGHWTVFIHAFRRRITLEYPEVKKELNENFRGKIYLCKDENDQILCKACGMCIKACPCKDVIKIQKDEDSNIPKPKKYEVDFSQCIFCGNCVHACPFGAIKMNRDYELAVYDKDSLSVDLVKEVE